MKSEMSLGRQIRRTVSRLGYSLAVGIIVGVILGLLADSLLLGGGLGSILGLAVGLMLVEQGQADRLKLGDPDQQRVVVLVISTVIFLLFLGLLWRLLT